jgi:tryptophan halogenase
MGPTFGRRKLRLGVVGVGTAGIVTISHLIPWLSNNWDVISIHDPSMPILGIGESTNPNMLTSIQQGMGFEEINDLKELEGTLKFGTRYTGWRKEDWVNPLFGGGHAIHFNNFKLKELGYKKFKELWPEKFKVLEGNVGNITNGFQCANVKINGINESFDYVIDCRGFPEDYSDYHMSDCSPLNKCFVHNVEPHITDQFTCTEHIATNHGWTFGIPLTTRHTYGYLFNSNITTDEEAISDLNEKFSANVSKEDLGVYEFKSYYANKILDGRILKNGNRALFFEPLSASSIWCYVGIAEMFAHHLEDPSKYDVSFMNTNFLQMARSLEDMLSFLYHGGTNYDTEFWRFAKTKALDRLSKSNAFRNTIKAYKQNAARGTPLFGDPWFFTPHSLRIIDKKMEYNYFKDDENTN